MLQSSSSKYTLDLSEVITPIGDDSSFTGRVAPADGKQKAAHDLITHAPQYQALLSGPVKARAATFRESFDNAQSDKQRSVAFKTLGQAYALTESASNLSGNPGKAAVMLARGNEEVSLAIADSFDAIKNHKADALDLLKGKQDSLGEDARHATLFLLTQKLPHVNSDKTRKSVIKFVKDGVRMQTKDGDAVQHGMRGAPNELSPDKKDMLRAEMVRSAARMIKERGPEGLKAQVLLLRKAWGADAAGRPIKHESGQRLRMATIEVLPQLSRNSAQSELSPFAMALRYVLRDIGTSRDLEGTVKRARDMVAAKDEWALMWQVMAPRASLESDKVTDPGEQHIILKHYRCMVDSYFMRTMAPHDNELKTAWREGLEALRVPKASRENFANVLTACIEAYAADTPDRNTFDPKSALWAGHSLLDHFADKPPPNHLAEVRKLEGKLPDRVYLDIPEVYDIERKRLRTRLAEAGSTSAATST